jgi:hypothetical protein
MNFEKLVEDLHDKAMEMADLGFINKHKGQHQEASNYFSQACKYEEKAALLAQENHLGQPTVGILFRSAATLASDYGDIDKMLLLTQKAVATSLLKWQQTEFLELIAHHRIKIHSLDETEINNLIYTRKLSKLRRELSAKTKRDFHKRKPLISNKKNHRIDGSFQGERQKVMSLL